jgi:crotonobetainyl-CoA:carnitine CoA-transferase CaiB-like acyl-CoA transferase
MIRTNEEWLQEPHGKILAAKPVVEIIKIGDSEPEPMPAGDRPLSGIKALDLTRILAGPITGRTLAEHGADVLMVSAPHLPQVWSYVADTSHGKRSCYLDLRDESEKQTLLDLVKTADVFSQGYRPDKINQMGLGPEALAEIRPGLVYVSINCYGADGPFSHRGGWEQIAQIMTGIAAEGVQSSSGYKPKTLPAAANDYITGYLGAYGTLLALARRAREGGSYHVRVSLCQTGMMIYDQGKVGTLPENLNLGMSDVDSLCMESDSHLGRIKHLAPVLSLSETRPYWALPTPKMGSNDPRWLG